MHSEGHFGLTLLILSLLSIPFGRGPENIIIFIIILGAGLSALPDIDIRLEIAHRKWTHNILFALIIGLIFGILFGKYNILYGFAGFIAGFMAVMTHLFGDLMTKMRFAPFRPFSIKEYSWNLFYSNNKQVNHGFFILGIFGLFGYILLT